MTQESQPQEEARQSRELSRADRIASWFLPNPGDILFMLIVWFLLWVRPSFVFGDGSTGWHIATGDFILKNGVPTKDFLSYTFPDKAWVAYEWLSDAIMATFVKFANGNLDWLGVCVICSVAALMMMLYERCRREGANFPFAFFLVIVGTMVSAIHWLARPHIFTFFGVYFFSIYLEDFWSGKLSGKQLLLRLSLIAVLWVNVHPAFMFAFALTGIYFASALFSAAFTFKTSAFAAYTGKVKVYFSLLFACAVATLINPYGLKLHAYLVDYFKGTPGLADVTNEFLSPVFHGGFQPVCLEILIGLLLVGLGLSRTRLSLPRLLMAVAFLHLTLSAVRNMPLFVLVILPIISQLSSKTALSEMLLPSSEESKTWFHSLNQKWVKLDQGFYENEMLCGKHMVPLVFFLFLSVAALNGGQLLGTQILKTGWSVEDKPTATIDYLRQELDNKKLDPERGFNYDNWGGYLGYKLKRRVSLDDRAEFFGAPYYFKYTVIAQNQPGWKEQLDGGFFKDTAKSGTSVQWVLMPKGSDLGHSLATDPNWGPAVKADHASELFVRKN
ncbi:MAG: hypothetical protein JST89_15460 [Cyanobacteria bacterium SZAS-4]|nr:hypothetical protein [Cyanobacteria bacterium SZAS-4]